MRGRYLNPANALTASRYLTLYPFWTWMDKGEIQLAWLMVLVSAVLDLLDGPAARFFNCSSGFGELFDAVTDGLCYGFYLACAVYYDHVPPFPIAVFIFLGVINSAMRAAYSKRAGRSTNFRSWAMERIVGYTAAFAGLAVVRYEAYYYSWAIPALMLVVVLWDAKRMLIDPIAPGPETSPMKMAEAEAEGRQ